VSSSQPGACLECGIAAAPWRAGNVARSPLPGGDIRAGVASRTRLAATDRRGPTAEKHCIISNALRTPVTLEAQVRVA
jgi:hypothetical protein